MELLFYTPSIAEFKKRLSTVCQVFFKVKQHVIQLIVKLVSFKFAANLKIVCQPGNCLGRKNVFLTTDTNCCFIILEPRIGFFTKSLVKDLQYVDLTNMAEIKKTFVKHLQTQATYVIRFIVKLVTANFLRYPSH